MKQLELCGYCTESGRFLLATRPWNDQSSSKNATCSSSTPLETVERAFVDLQHWDRLLRCTSSSYCQRLPTKRWRKLMEFNWIRGNACAGWRIELQKSVVTCETWLNHAFPHLSTQQQRAFLDDDMYAALKQKHAAARANNRHARDLQQYFSSPELVKFVVAQVLKVVEVHQVVWLEPSCGDGRFLTTLVRAGAQDVVGYEIDDKLQHVAAQRVARAVADVATRSGPLPRASEIPIHAQVYQGDFLVSRSCVPAHKCVVALGNPPYGARRDDGSDLVHRFLEHAANEWRARVIVFIVPTRCARPAFLETTFALLRGGSQSAPATVSSWKLVAESSLGDYHFELRTGDTLKRVRQPSVLQLFVRDTQRVEPPAG